MRISCEREMSLPSSISASSDSRTSDAPCPAQPPPARFSMCPGRVFQNPRWGRIPARCGGSAIVRPLRLSVTQTVSPPEGKMFLAVETKSSSSGAGGRLRWPLGTLAAVPSAGASEYPHDRLLKLHELVGHPFFGETQYFSTRLE